MSAQKATKCYQLRCCLWHLGKIMQSSKKYRRSWISVHQCLRAEKRNMVNLSLEENDSEREIGSRPDALARVGVILVTPCTNYAGESWRGATWKGNRVTNKEHSSSTVWPWSTLSPTVSCTFPAHVPAAEALVCAAGFPLAELWQGNKGSLPGQIHKWKLSSFEKMRNIFMSCSFPEEKDLPVIFFLERCYWACVQTTKWITNNADFLVP